MRIGKFVAEYTGDRNWHISLGRSEKRDRWRDVSIHLYRPIGLWLLPRYWNVEIRRGYARVQVLWLSAWATW